MFFDLLKTDQFIKGILKKNKGAVICTCFLIIVILMGILAPIIAPNDPNESIFENKGLGMSLHYPMGTDNLGRCIFSRCIYGIRTSLGISIIISVVGILIGTCIGVFSGYCGGIVDNIIMRICDALLAFPDLILVLIIVGMLGIGTTNIIIAMLLVHWIWYARVSRSMTMSLKKRSFIQAAKISGSSDLKIIVRHIMPNILSQLIVLFTIDMGGVILSLAGYSFLGIGVQPPTAEWGVMINEGRTVIRQNIMAMLWPSIMIVTVVFSLNVVGECLRSQLDDPIQ